MGSTFGGLEISKRGLSGHQSALDTTGHNISNADNKSYARQRVNMQSMDPLYAPSFNRAGVKGQLGQGMDIGAIERIRDAFYDDQIISAENSQNYWRAHNLYLTQIEHIFNEPTDNSLRSLMNKFWGSWQELANYPSDMAHREVVLERAQALVSRIHDSYNKLRLLRKRADQEILTDIAQLNRLGAEVRDLNARIMKLQALGDNPNDLLDRRDLALEKLAALADIRVGRGDKDELIVFIGEQAFVQGEILRRLQTEADPENEGYSKIVWEHNRKETVWKGGHILGLLEMRDNAIKEHITQVDSYAINIADIVNETHRNGFGLNAKTKQNFFDIRSLSPNADSSFVLEQTWGGLDLNDDGASELTALFRLTGTQQVDAKARIAMRGTLTFFRNDAENSPVLVEYRENDTLEDVVERINESRAGLVAYLKHEGYLSLKALPASDDSRTNFMIRHIEDSGELLVGYTGLLATSGAAGAFDFRRVGELSKLRSASENLTLTPMFHPAAHIQVAQHIAADPASIAAAQAKDTEGGDIPNGRADGSNALRIAAALKQDKPMLGYAENPEEFYNALISKLGTASRAAEDALQRHKDDLTALQALRQSVMGVSLDEEMSNMIQFQHAYNASARMMQTQSEMLEQIIERLGS